MGESAHRHGLFYNFLLLYLNGDNLYPHIRFSPPIFGEKITYLDGTPGRWYKYWSPKAQESMKDHVNRIMESYGKGCQHCITEEGEEVIPVCSMWDPVVAVSFDEEGQNRYRSYLKEFYHNDIQILNENYGICAQDFESLSPEEYWYEVKYPEGGFYTEEDVKNRTPKFYVWRDNTLWKIHEMTEYFKEIGPKLKEKNPDLFLCPDLSQWGYFLKYFWKRATGFGQNEFSDLWDTAIRRYSYVRPVSLFGFLSFHYGSGYTRWHYRCLCSFLPAQHDAGNESGQTYDRRYLLGTLYLQ